MIPFLCECFLGEKHNVLVLINVICLQKNLHVYLFRDSSISKSIFVEPICLDTVTSPETPRVEINENFYYHSIEQINMCDQIILDL